MKQVITMPRFTAFLSALVFSFGLMTAAPSYGQARTETIAAVVNEDAVSVSDVNERIKLVIASSGMPDNQDIREKLEPQILNILIDEKLKLQEAERLEIFVGEADIEQGFAAIAAQNKFSADQFRSVLRNSGVSPQTLKDQIHAQIAWSQVIGRELRPQVAIADKEVDSVLNRLKASQGKDEYLVSEIFLPVDKPTEEADTRKLADKLMKELEEGKVPFQRLASQFSQAAGAAKGGDIGWVQEGQLPQELDQVLAQMGEGELSQPIRSLAGYHILALRKKRTITEVSIPSREQIMQDLGIERLDRLQRSYLLDLKTQAFIEERV